MGHRCLGFRAARGGAVIALLLILPMAAPSQADTISDQRRKVADAESRLESLQNRLSQLIGELDHRQEEVELAAANAGVSYVRMRRAEASAQQARLSLELRARKAYIRSRHRGAHMLLQSRSLAELFLAVRVMATQVAQDARVYEDMVKAAEELDTQRADAQLQKQLLVQATRDLESLKQTISETLSRQQEELSRRKDVLAELEAKRRAALASATRPRGPSPAVEARRAARQVLLDAKLKALIDWYSPASGAEPFMPPKLTGTGVVTEGMSSWYGPGFDGRRASSGATYRQEQPTAASLVLPFGTLLKVSFRGRSVVVVITDRGPYIPGRVLDLSAGAAQAIGLTGVQKVRMEIVKPTEPAPPFP